MDEKKTQLILRREHPPYSVDNEAIDGKYESITGITWLVKYPSVAISP